MSIFDDDNFIEITSNDLNDAAIVLKGINDSIKQRVFANVLGARLGIKYLASLDVKADNYKSIYTIKSVLQDIDVADIYTNNNIKIDIRIVKDKNSLCVPISHFNYNITPDIYIFIMPAQDLMSADYVGAIPPEEIDKSISDGNYYIISPDTIYNENSLKNVLKNSKTREYQPVSENELIKAESLLVNFIDKDILNKDKVFLYDILKRSQELRNMFKDFESFEHISTELAHTNEILSDSVLDILGAQELYKNENGELASEVDLDELAEITAADFVEDFIDGNEEQNMPDNNIIDGEFQELPEDNADNSEFNGILEDLPTDEELAQLDKNNIEDEQEQEQDIIDSEQPEIFEGFEGLGQNLIPTETLSGDIEVAADFISIPDNTEIIAETDDADALDIVSDESNETNDTVFVQENLEQMNDVENSMVDNTSDFEFNNDIQELNNIELIDEPNVDLNEEESNTVDNLSEFEFSNNIQELDNTELIKEPKIDTDITEDSTVNNLSDFQFSTDVQELDNTELIEEQNIEVENTENTNFQEDNLEEQEISEDTEIDDINKRPQDNTLMALDSPIDFSLPELIPSEDLPFFEEIKEGENEIQSNNSQEETAIDENDNTNIDENSDIPIEGFYTDNSVQESENLSTEFTNNNEDEQPTLTLNDIAEEINFDNNENLPLNFDSETQEIDSITDEDGALQVEHAEENIEINNKSFQEEDDMGGLEEFTMDMAEATERANPNLLNPDFASDLQNNDYNYQDNVTTENNFEPQTNDEVDNQNVISLESFDLNILDNNNNTDTSSDNISDNSQNLTENSINLDDINLDELDVYDDNETETSEKNEQEIDVNDIDVDSINLNDIDLNNINIDEFDIIDDEPEQAPIQEENYTDMNASSLSEIPEIIPEENMQYNNYEQPMDEMNTINEQNGYIPDYNENDRQTIETLYQNNNPNQSSGDVLDETFNNNDVNNLPQQPNKIKQKKKTSPLVGIALIVLVCAFCYVKKDLILSKINSVKGTPQQEEQNMPIEGETQEDKEDQELLNDNTENQDEMQNEQKQGIGEIPGENGGPQDAASMEASLNQNRNNIQKISDANYAKTPEPLASSEIKRLYWEIPQDLTYNESIVKYLKTVGKTMKFGIQSDLLNTSELPYSNKMIVDVVIKKDGTAESITTSVSSGSKQIDNIVLQTVKAALKYVKAPTAEFKNDSYNFSLIINF